MTKLITVTHAASGLKMRINPDHIAALVPSGALGADPNRPAKAKSAVTLSTGNQFYLVNETVPVIAALIEGVKLTTVDEE
jgi:hypothetical protein